MGLKYSRIKIISSYALAVAGGALGYNALVEFGEPNLVKGIASGFASVIAGTSSYLLYLNFNHEVNRDHVEKLNSSRNSSFSTRRNLATEIDKIFAGQSLGNPQNEEIEDVNDNEED